MALHHIDCCGWWLLSAFDIVFHVNHTVLGSFKYEGEKSDRRRNGKVERERREAGRRGVRRWGQREGKGGEGRGGERRGGEGRGGEGR